MEPEMADNTDVEARLADLEKRVSKLEFVLAYTLKEASAAGAFAKYGLEDVESPGAIVASEGGN
jgi:hypothetical protein